jgi:uncharacterized protein involved in exopolysaccharide biosynthesis
MSQEKNGPAGADAIPAAVPAPPAFPPGYCAGVEVEEDEINLLDLFIVLLRHKVLIFSIVFLAGVAAVAVSLQLPNIYQSSATIAPTAQEQRGGLSALGGLGAMIASEAGITAAGSIEQFDVVLKSRELTASIVRKYDLLPYLFEDGWDPVKKAWLEEAPKVEQIHKAMQDRLSVSTDKKKNVMTVGFEAKEPEKARAILGYYIEGLSEFLRNQILADAAAQRRHLGEQLAKTPDPLLRNRLYELMAKQIEQETLARVQKYYSFNVVDPPYLPEQKFKPKRAQICILSVVVALFLAVFLAFFLEYLRNLRTREDPARLESLRAAFRFRKN